MDNFQKILLNLEEKQEKKVFIQKKVINFHQILSQDFGIIILPVSLEIDKSKFLRIIKNHLWGLNLDIYNIIERVKKEPDFIDQLTLWTKHRDKIKNKLREWNEKNI